MNFPVDFRIGFTYIKPLLGWLALFSLVTFVISLVLIPFVVERLSADCFLQLHSNNKVISPPSIRSIIVGILRNSLGMALLLAGVIMLFIPGQGLLTILLGALLISFPGKRTLIRGLVFQPKIQDSLDWLRKKRGKPPFLWPPAPDKLDRQ
jgi:hypothetical protein